MDFFNKSKNDYKNLRNNAVARANGGESVGMTKGDWAGIGLQLLGAISQQKAQDDELKALKDENIKGEMMAKGNYRDTQQQLEDAKTKREQDTRYRGLNFMNDQVESSRAMARKRGFAGALYDYMRS